MVYILWSKYFQSVGTYQCESIACLRGSHVLSRSLWHPDFHESFLYIQNEIIFSCDFWTLAYAQLHNVQVRVLYAVCTILPRQIRAWIIWIRTDTSRSWSFSKFMWYFWLILRQWHVILWRYDPSLRSLADTSIGDGNEWQSLLHKTIADDSRADELWRCDPVK